MFRIMIWTRKIVPENFTDVRLGLAVTQKVSRRSLTPRSSLSSRTVVVRLWWRKVTLGQVYRTVQTFKLCHYQPSTYHSSVTNAR
jgi:hypothetical protein